MHRALACALVIAAWLVASARAAAAPIAIQVRGGAQLRVSAARDANGVAIRGELVDDTGAPLAGMPVTIQGIAASDASRPMPLPPPGACERRGVDRATIRHDRPTEYAIETDDRGAFCVRTSARLDGGSVRARFAGTKLYEGAETTAAVTEGAALARTIVRFEPAPGEIDLDREARTVSVSLRIERTGETAPGVKREGLVIQIEDERGRVVAEGATGGDGRARLDVNTADLAGPGAGELRARFEGTAFLAPATTSHPVVRTAEVRLQVAPVPPGDPSSGIAIDVEALSSRGPVTGGVVEGTRGTEHVGAGQVEAGRARPVLSFDAERAGTAPITLRYVPSSPYFRPGRPVHVEIPLRGPGVLRQLLLGAAVVAVALWVVGGWRRAPKPAVAEEPRQPSPPSGRAGVMVIAPATGQAGWSGTVLDAHEGTPIAGADVTLVVPAFQGDGVVARATTDARGAFALEARHEPGARLVVEAPLHSRHEQALPPPSVLAIALVTRRRALLDRLVRWAKRHGAPFDGPPEPTPGHVRRAAARANAAEVEAWAGAVERAAFGPDAVDRSAEQALRDREPRAVR